MFARIGRRIGTQEVQLTGAGPERAPRPGSMVESVRQAAGLHLAITLATFAVLPAGAKGQELLVPVGAAQAEQDVCAQCHAVEHYRASTHGTAVSCLSCHQDDRHRDFPQDFRAVAAQRVARCVGCHDTLEPSHPHVAAVAPLCTDCHSVHQDPPIEGAIPVLARRCGACHASELSEFEAGAHAGSIALDAPNADLPNCITCHPNHVASPSKVNARLEATARCIECHSSDMLSEQYDIPRLAGKSYEDDFHGATLQFLWRHPAAEEQPDVMVCSDCHGAHKVEWMARGEVGAVCLGCHEEADEKIAGAWLGHQPINRDNGIIVWAVRVFYYIFIPLVLGGLLLHILYDIRYQRRHPGRHKTRGRAGTVRVTRFSPIERMEHLFSMTTFTLLVITGLPQSYPESTVGNWFIQLWGGIGSTRLIHRAAGVFFVSLLVLHVGRATFKAIRSRRMPVMIATRKDFTDVLQTLRHFLGNAPAPRVGKFDFREKFEYWGLFLGGILMSVTGFILLFPEGASQVLPGAVLAAARVMHGLEATFAVLVVILWHSWGVILRPEVFPLDTSIFTGKISLARLREEHPLEYERIFGPDSAERQIRHTA